MINFNDYTNKNKTEHKPKWPYIMLVKVKPQKVFEVIFNFSLF